MAMRLPKVHGAETIVHRSTQEMFDQTEALSVYDDNVQTPSMESHMYTAESSDSAPEEQEILLYGPPVADFKTFNLNDDGFPLCESELKKNRRRQQKAFINYFGEASLNAAIGEYKEITGKSIKTATRHILTYATPEIIRHLVCDESDSKLYASRILRYCTSHNVHPSSTPWGNSLLADGDKLIGHDPLND